MVKVLKPFYDGASRTMVHPGDAFDPAADRHVDLARLGLVEPPKGDDARKVPAKAKPKPAAKVGLVQGARPPRRRKLVG